MCGIFGYTGRDMALGITLNGLAKLEYRGYDSAGTAFFDGGRVNILRTTNKIASLIDRTRDTRDDGTAIAHTRWATHGSVSERNAHPQQSGRVTLVHNGIIENYRDILSRMPILPESDTDTEAAAMLIDSLYDGDPVSAVQSAVQAIRGSFAFAILFSDRPGEIYAAHRESPLTILECEKGCFLSSDPAAFAEYGKTCVVPAEDAVACLKPDGCRVYGDKETVTVRDADVFEDKAGYDHYMIKEILEQPRVLRRTIESHTQGGRVVFSAPGAPDALFADVDTLHVIACGTAMHAGCTAARFIESVADIPVEAHIASEFACATVRVRASDLYIFISQSGETADTLAALRRVREKGGRVLAIVNKRGTTLERECGNTIYTFAGPEIAVASTKAFTCQLAALYLVGIRLARGAGKMTAEDESRALSILLSAADQVQDSLRIRPAAQKLSQALAAASSIFYLGRATDYALAREGALKIKEISYIHAEAMAAGEMKHGTISLICPETPTVIFLTESSMKDKILLCAQEISSRGGRVIFVATEDMADEAGQFGDVLRLPASSGVMAAFSAAVALQMLAYETALRLGRSIDQPRNLAKSVTVS